MVLNIRFYHTMTSEMLKYQWQKNTILYTILYGLLCWWIFIVPEVVLNLVYLSIFSGLAALMSADIARNL